MGAAKTAAENQFVTVREKIKKLAKGKAKTDPKATAAAAPAPATTGATSARLAPLQTATAPPAGAFTQSNQPRRALHALPAATDAPPAMSFVSPAKAEPAPLTAMPDAKPETTKPEAKPAAAAKPKAKPQARGEAGRQQAGQAGHQAAISRLSVCGAHAGAKGACGRRRDSLMLRARSRAPGRGKARA